MDNATARKLNALTGDFYRRQSASFSETRQAPWEGWNRVLEETLPSPSATYDHPGAERLLAPGDEKPAPAIPRELSVLDVGCGNLRFERFLAERSIPFRAVALDRCVELISKGREALEANDSPTTPHPRKTFEPSVDLREADVIGALLDGDDASLDESLESAEGYDLVVAFGFMHHVPGSDARGRLCRALFKAVAPGGYLALSFWQFLNSPRIAAKAHAATARALDAGAVPRRLDEGDFLLGWQHETDVLRYCHHFDDAEITRIVESLGVNAVESSRFSADGKSHDLNRYVIVRKEQGERPA